MNDFLKRKTLNKKSNRHGRISEASTMKKLGAKQTPGSGSLAGAKSDGTSPHYRYENKSTIHKSWSVKKETLDKIADEARGYGQVPVITLSFVNGSGASVPGGDFIIIRRVDFQELNELAYGEEY